MGRARRNASISVPSMTALSEEQLEGLGGGHSDPSLRLEEFLCSGQFSVLGKVTEASQGVC